VGTPLVYTSTTLELAALEVLVHLHGTPLLDLPPQVQIELEVPDHLVETIAVAHLPPEWSQQVPPNELAHFLLSRLAPANPFIGFALPSVIMPNSSSRNVLLNPKHSLIHEVCVIGILEHYFDKRLLHP
jgi:hypothetical protein